MREQALLERAAKCEKNVGSGEINVLFIAYQQGGGNLRRASKSAEEVATSTKMEGASAGRPRESWSGGMVRNRRIQG